MSFKINDRFKRGIIILAASLVVTLVLAIGISRAINGNISVSVVVAEQFPKLSGKLISFSTEDSLYEYARVPFITKFQNTGGVALKPAGNIVIKNQFAKTVAIIPVNQYGAKITPGATDNYFSQWYRENNWGSGLGWYSADLALNYGINETLNSSLKFFIFPWKIVLFSIIYLLAVYILNNIFWHLQLQLAPRLSLNFKNKI